MEEITITPEKLEALIHAAVKAAVKEELADFFFRNQSLELINIPLPKENRKSKPLANGDKKIDEMDISVRLFRLLWKHKIRTLQDMVELDWEVFRKFRGSTKRLWSEFEENIKEETQEKDS